MATKKNANVDLNNNNNNNNNNMENNMDIIMQMQEQINALKAELAAKTAKVEAPKVNVATKEDSFFNSLCNWTVEAVSWAGEKTLGNEGYVRQAAVASELYVRNEAAHQAAGVLASMLETVSDYSKKAAVATREKEQEWMPKTADEARIVLTAEERAKFTAYMRQQVKM